MGDSPLVSPTVGGKAPKDTPNSMAASQANLLSKMEQAVEEQKTEVKPKADLAGASGWKAKLEKIKAQKAARAEEERQKAAAEAIKLANLDPEIQEIRS